MNYKLEKFWNKYKSKWVVEVTNMNYKLEKFLNLLFPSSFLNLFIMNYKLEKFWNDKKIELHIHIAGWTINLKSFEI